jgi:hypothetical protein
METTVNVVGYQATHGISEAKPIPARIERWERIKKNPGESRGFLFYFIFKKYNMCHRGKSSPLLGE